MGAVDASEERGRVYYKNEHTHECNNPYILNREVSKRGGKSHFSPVFAVFLDSSSYSPILLATCLISLATAFLNRFSLPFCDLRWSN